MKCILKVMDIQQPFVTQEQKFKFWTEAKDEIQQLRKQVAGLESELHSMNINCQGWIAKSKEQKEQNKALSLRVAELEADKLKKYADYHKLNKEYYALSLQVAQLREALEEVGNRFFHPQQHPASRDIMWDMVNEALNTTPNADEWIKRSELEEFSTQMEHGGRISKLYRLRGE